MADNQPESSGTNLVSLPKGVIKRDGSLAPFDSEKIRSAIQRAGAATGEFDANEAFLLTAQVVKVLIHKFRAEPPHIENIQDVVEQVLISANHLKTARAYIVYREQHTKLRQDRKTVVDVESSINEYLDQLDWRVNANANQGYSPGRPDPQRLRQGGGQLLAQPRLSAGSRRGPPRRRHPHPRPRHAGRLLRRLVAAHPAARGPQRRAGQGRGRPAQAHVLRRRPDRQLPRHAAERVGRRAGVLLLRHLHGAVHPQGQPALCAASSSTSRN